MNRHTKWIITAIALISTVIAPRIRAQFLNEISPEAIQQIQALEAEKESRTPAQKKINSQLLYAIKMERGEPIAAGIRTLTVDVGADATGMVTANLIGNVNSSLLGALSQMGVKVVA